MIVHQNAISHNQQIPPIGRDKATHVCSAMLSFAADASRDASASGSSPCRGNLDYLSALLAVCGYRVITSHQFKNEIIPISQEGRIAW